MIGIYKIENLVNGKVYIGQSVNIKGRFAGHRKTLNKNNHCNLYLQRAWNKYGNDKFEFTVIEECSVETLNDREIHWINKYNSLDTTYGYNIRDGGSQGKLSDSTRKILSEKMKETYKDATRTPMYGKKHTDKSRKLMSDIVKERYSNPGEREKVSNGRLALKTKNNTSGYMGVSANSRSGKWIARIRTGGQRKYIGIFDNPVLAALAYDVESWKAYHMLSRVNFPENYKEAMA